MLELRHKRIIVIGAADGVPSQSIQDALRQCDVNVVLSINQYFV